MRLFSPWGVRSGLKKITKYEYDEVTVRNFCHQLRYSISYGSQKLLSV